ncbi:MAG: DUF4345 family protein [Thermoleophilaceae bacterium]|nr:DUF4345 family protein [Thermoleophilaceae bacterium]
MTLARDLGGVRNGAEAPLIRSFGRSALRAVVCVGGVVATVGGLHTVIAGAKSLPAQQLANSSVESELRFYAAFYFAYGWVAVGRPHELQRGLLAIELAAPPLIVAWQARFAAPG